MKLRFITMRRMRSHVQRVKCVQEDVEKVEEIMNKQKLDGVRLDNKLPDFKVKQIQSFYTKEPGRQMLSPYCLLTNTNTTEDQFLKKFKENTEVSSDDEANTESSSK